LIGRLAGNPDMVRRLARAISDAADRGASITRRLLAFARRAELHRARLDTARLLNETGAVLADAIGSGIALRMDLPPDLPPLFTDRRQLETVLGHLAANARDAMPHGGTLTLSAVAEPVAGGSNHRVGLAAGNYVCLTIADTGSGMDADTLQRAAEPFFSTKAPHQAPGLGLAMTKSFAEESGGGLAIDSVPGQGTVVTLWLPQAVPDTGDAPLVTMPPEPKPTARVLVVDDDAMVLEVLAGQLRAEGCAVTAAASGAEALRLLDEGTAVDVLVTDLSMPGMDGVTLISQARARHPDLPSLVLTGYAPEGNAAIAGRVTEGMFTLLRKPVTSAQLMARVSALLPR
jgi:CheY-like chemotaxis protein